MKFNKIVGFRSGRRRIKVIALIGYFLFVTGLFGKISVEPTPWDVFIHKISWTMLFLSILIAIANLFSNKEKAILF
jgi:hypothetical protein